MLDHCIKFHVDLLGSAGRCMAWLIRRGWLSLRFASHLPRHPHPPLDWVLDTIVPPSFVPASVFYSHVVFTSCTSPAIRLSFVGVVPKQEEEDRSAVGR